MGKSKAALKNWGHIFMYGKSYYYKVISSFQIDI